MENSSSSIENVHELGVIERVIATKLTGRVNVNSRQVYREFERYSKRLNPDQRRAVLNEGFTEAVAAHLEAGRLPESDPQKEYAELRAQTISEFMGWLGNASGDVADVKAGKNTDGTYQRIAPVHYKASLAVDGYKRATEKGDVELVEAIKRTVGHAFEEPLEVLMDDSSSAVSTTEVDAALNKARIDADKLKVRPVHVLAATAISLAAVATTATPSAANEKAPEVAEVDNKYADGLYDTKAQKRPYKLDLTTRSTNEAVAIKEVGLSDDPAPAGKVTSRPVDESEATTVLQKAPAKAVPTFTPETIKAKLPVVEKVPDAKPAVPKVVTGTFKPDSTKAEMPKVARTAPKEVAIPKEIADTLAPEIVKIDSGLDEEAPKVTIVAPTPVAPAPAPETEAAPAPEQGPYVLNDEQNGLIDSLSLSPSQKAFLKQVTAGAIGLHQRGSKVNPEVVIAQSILESGWGGSDLTKQANNYFGMKAGTAWKGKTVVMPTREFINGSWVTVDATWQAFASAEECFAEYEKFIQERTHFADALQHSSNPEEYVKALVNGDLKYATDPSYVQKIMGTVKANHLSRIVEIANKVQADKTAATKAAETKQAEEAKAAAEPANNAVPASHIETQIEEFTGWHHPVPVGSPLSPQYPGHRGYDYAVPAGTPFYAAMGGTVKVLEFNVKDEQFCKDAFKNIGASMNLIKDPIQKEVRITRTIGKDTYEVIYAHMSQIDVKDGQIVKGDDQIGKSGNSGCSTGDHAHIEIRVNGVSIDLNALFIHGKIQPMGAAKPASAEADTYTSHAEHADEVSHTPEVASDSKLTDEQKRKLAAIKHVVELKKNLAAAQESSQPLVADGYLSVR
jgi:flagellum-specific peptidoglycan hydrolase FlgJ